MADIDLSRREVLAGAGGFGALVVGTGSGAAADVGEYNVGTASPAAERAARNAADRVQRVLDWKGGKKTLTLTLPEEAARNLRKRSDVRYVEENGEMRAIGIDSGDSEVPWGVDRVDAEKAHANGETGGDGTDGEGGADIAIIDTGIDDDHPDLEANVGKGKAFVDCKGPNCNYPWSDDNDHGTHCAGTADALDNSEGVVGVSTEATLHAVKVLDKRGSGSYSDVAAGIKWVAEQGYDVASMSLGGGKSSAVEDAVETAYSEGVLLVGAAGNDGPCTDCVGYPAAEPEVIAVSATTKNDSLAGFSSTGSEVELAAPGKDIYSTVIGGYDTLSGTSMACPHVSGAGGQLMDNGYANTEARNQLNATAEDIGLGSNEQGNGLLDVEAALGGSSDSDAAPSVSWVNPGDGETVSGTITVQIDASDSEDGDGSLDVTYSVDGGSSRSTAYNSTSGYYEDSWDTTGVSDGDHTLEATATDSAGNTSASSITVTTDNIQDTSSAPAIEKFALTDDSNPAWTRYYVDWAVSDGDGDLSSVTSELLDSAGAVLDSESGAVSGASASGTHYVETKGSASDIRLTVTDGADNSTTDSKSI